MYEVIKAFSSLASNLILSLIIYLFCPQQPGLLLHKQSVKFWDDIPRLAERIQLEVDDLLPILDSAVLLGFAEVAQGDVKLTEIGKDFATTTIQRSKDLFRQQVLNNMPMIVSMVQTLREKRNRAMRADFFVNLLDEYYSHEEAERQFATAVDCGRYTELFKYDAGENRLYLPEPVEAVSSESESME